MATVVHSFLEYADTASGEGFSGDPADPALLFGEFHIIRDYDLFDALANARSRQVQTATDRTLALFPPRGVPADLSHGAAIRYFDLIEDSTFVSGHFWPSHGRVSTYEARGRVESGDAHYGAVAQTFGERKMWRTVSKPLWHTPSWLFLEEVDAALWHFGLEVGALKFDFRLLCQTMKNLEAELGAGRVRLVFWFDN